MRGRVDGPAPCPSLKPPQPGDCVSQLEWDRRADRTAASSSSYHGVSAVVSGAALRSTPDTRESCHQHCHQHRHQHCPCLTSSTRQTMETQTSSGHEEGELGITPVRTDDQQQEKLADTARAPADDSDTDEGLGGLGLGKSKSKPKSTRTRRARRKAYRPYYQLSQGERDGREEREKLRVAKLKERMLAKGRIIAPYNTTQFLMADQLEEDFYFSNQVEDDQDFMSNEFKKEYEVHNLNRLEKMSKEMLLNEYMILERKNEKLEEKLETIKKLEEVHVENVNGRINPDVEFTNRVINLQSEMEKLKMENQRLLAENQEMKKRLSTDTESEESSGSSSSSSCSSDEDYKENLLEEKKSIKKLSSSSDDPGYESNQSKGEIK